MKRNSIAAVSLAALAALALAGCASGSPTESSEPTASPTSSTTPESPTGPLMSFGSAADLTLLESITWEQEASGELSLAFDMPLTLSGSASLVLSQGTGDVIADGQDLSLEYTVTSGTDGSVVYSTYENGRPDVLPLSEGVDPALLDVLVGNRVGMQVIYGQLDAEAAPVDGVTPSIFIAITVEAASDPLKRAEGTAVPPVDGLPVVTLAENGAPSITIPTGYTSAELVAQTLIEGTGAEVLAGQTVYAHYTGWLLNGTQFDSSWDRGTPLSIALREGSVIDGWTQGLVGQKIGSQVLLVIPPALGYGDVAQGDIPPGSTLVFVVDILRAS